MQYQPPSANYSAICSCFVYIAVTVASLVHISCSTIASALQWQEIILIALIPETLRGRCNDVISTLALVKYYKLFNEDLLG